MKKIQGIYEENGYTKIRIWIGPKRNPDGGFNPPYRRSMGVYNNENIQRAKNHIDNIRRDLQKGIRPMPEPEPVVVPMVCDIYYKRHWVNKRGRSAESIRNVGYKLNFFRTYWKTRAWHTINSQDIEEYMVWRKRQKGPKGEPIADGTVDNELNLLSSMFTMMREWNNRREIGPYSLPTTVEGIPYNPVECIERDSLVGTKRERVATLEELCKVKAYCNEHDPDMWHWITRAIITGLRKTDLSMVNGLADVRGVLSKSKEKKLFRFLLDFSVRLQDKNFTGRWNNLREACDMMDFHWHDWRHTSATMLKFLGFSDKQIQEFLHHTSEEQTRDYINTGGKHLEPQVKALQGSLDGVSQSVPPSLPQDASKKVCLGCGELKPLEAYGKHSAFKSGLNSRCRACNYKATKEQRQRNPAARAKEYAKKQSRSLNSAVECLPHTEEVASSNLAGTTISEKDRSVSKSVSISKTVGHS